MKLNKNLDETKWKKKLKFHEIQNLISWGKKYWNVMKFLVETKLETFNILNVIKYIKCNVIKKHNKMALNTIFKFHLKIKWNQITIIELKLHKILCLEII